MKAPRTAWLAISAFALVITACTGGEGDPESPTRSGDTRAEKAVVNVDDPPGSTKGFVGAVKDADPTRCEADGAAWISEGTITNPTKKTQNYRLYVSFMRKQEAAGLVQVDVKSVKPRASAPWKAQARVPGEALTCELRVERFPTRG